MVGAANELRREIGLGPTADISEAAELVLTSAAMEVIQVDGQLIHPKSMESRDAAVAWAFVCFMAVPIISFIESEGKTIDAERFLVAVAAAVFQFYGDGTSVQIYRSGTAMFQKVVRSGGDRASFVEFNDQVNNLTLLRVLHRSEPAVGGLRNRYAAFRKLILGST